MKLQPAATHEGCAASCGAGASLACIQNDVDDALAATVSAAGAGYTQFLWLGEFQWPLEQHLGDYITSEGFAAVMTLPMHGQKGWGRCSNGQSTNYTPGKMGTFQPNNFNYAEDCIGYTRIGYADNVCNQVLPCLCEWPSQTSAEYVSEYGPALTARAEEAHAALIDTMLRSWTTCVLLCCVPALLLVLYMELFMVRWRQRTAAVTDAEAKLRDTNRLALRRRMLQAGLSLTLGGILIGLSIPPLGLAYQGKYPVYGFGTSPTGNATMWQSLRPIGIAIVLLALRPADTAAIRIASFAFFVLSLLDVVWMRPTQDKWHRVYYWPEWLLPMLNVVNAIIVAFMLVPCVFWRRHALPGRRALRWMWVCVRLFFLLYSVEHLVDYLAWGSFGPVGAEIQEHYLQG